MVKSLFINRLLVFPSKKVIDVRFKKGLNIILAEDVGDKTNETRNSVGKTTFTELIDYGLGSKSFLSDEKSSARSVMQAMKLYFEFSISSKKYTIIRNLVENESVHLYEGWVINELLEEVEIEYTPYTLKQYNAFLEKEIYEGANKFKDKKLFSWRQIISLLIRDQVGGFLSLDKPGNYNESAQVRRGRIEFLLNLLTTEKAELEVQQVEAEGDVAEKQKAYNVIAKYAAHKQQKLDTEVLIQRSQIKRKLIQSNNELDLLKHKIANSHKLKDEEEEKRVQASRQKLEIKNVIWTYKQRIDDYKATVNEIQSELEKINLTKSAFAFFHRFDYTQCPLCLRSFGENEEECKHSINQISNESIELIKTILSNEKGELLQSIEVHDKEVLLLTEECNELEIMINYIDEKIKKRTDEDFMQINILEEEILKQEKELVKLKSAIDLKEDVEFYKKDWEESRQKLKAINKSIKGMLKNAIDRQIAFEEVVREVVGFLFANARTGTFTRSKRAGNFSLEINHVATGEVDDGAASFPLRVIAFDLALLKLSLFENTNHPHFLVHDSPNVYDIDPKVYRRIFDFILKLEAAYDKIEGSDFQYIITTIEIPEKFRNSLYVRLKLDNSGEEGKLFGFTY